MGYSDPDDISKVPGFNLAVESDRRVMATEAKPDFEPWMKEALGLSARESVPAEFVSPNRMWNLYHTRGRTAESGSYPEGRPFNISSDFFLGEGTGMFGPKAPVRQISPGVKASYGRMSRALRRGEGGPNLGVAWAGAYGGPSRDPDLLREGMEPRERNQEVAQSSAFGLANLNQEQHGFTFPWDIKTGSPAYPEDELAKFKEVGWRKSYVERGGQNVPLPDDCVEVVSLTTEGPIYKSSGLPGCP
tara:strand:+ start:360 stop:1097 length:738 start_codon:yes stop_codon:yes gene_type:complete